MVETVHNNRYPFGVDPSSIPPVVGAYPYQVERTYESPHLRLKALAVVDFAIGKINVDNVAFLGGSRRFGYSKPHSDWDVFVYTPNKEQLVKGLNLDKAHNLGYKVTGFEHYYTNVFNEPVDMLLTESWDAWDKLSCDHILVEEFLDNNPIVLSVTQKMAPHMMGKHVYRTLLSSALRTKHRVFPEGDAFGPSERQPYIPGDI